MHFIFPTLFLTLFLSLPGSMLAQTQLGFTGGPVYCWVRNNNILENEKPIFSYTLGSYYRYHPIKEWPKVSIQNELLISRKGYQQDLDKNYKFYFIYLSANAIVNYSICSQISVYGGTEINNLIFTNLIQGKKTYSKIDFSLTSGIAFFENLPVSFYTRINYGLIPMLNYYKIDKMGNFTEKFCDLKNTSISLGLRINFLWTKPKINE